MGYFVIYKNAITNINDYNNSLVLETFCLHLNIYLSKLHRQGLSVIAKINLEYKNVPNSIKTPAHMYIRLYTVFGNIISYIVVSQYVSLEQRCV